MIYNSIFKEVVVANADEVFDSCTFESGTTAKEKNVFGLSINGNANVTVKNCKFTNKGYSAVYLNSTGEINLENNQIDCTGLYNPIEGGSGTGNAQLTKVNAKGNVLEGICGNNYFNFYVLADDAIVNLENNTIKGMSQQAEVLRLSNHVNHTATFNLKNMSYAYDMTTEYSDHWTKLILCQDYTNGSIEDFSKFTVNIEGLKCNGIDVTKEEDYPVGGTLCVYDQYKSVDSTTQYPTTNNPIINFK